MATTFRNIFLKAAEAFCWLIGTVSGMFLLVLALTLFASTSSTHPSPSSAPTASSTSYHGTCDEDELHRLMATHVGYVVCAMAIAMLLMVFVRKVADGAAKDHERVAASEDAAYKAAYDAAEVAKEAIGRAEKEVKELNDPRRVNLALGVLEGDQALADARKKLDACVQEYRRATDKVERLKPKEGIARLNKRWRIAARSAFSLAICAHYIGLGCVGFAFYYSLEIETKCMTSFLTILLFVLTGVVSTTIHGLLLWVSLTQN
ncbi:unnamed protein product [Triticum turgidum subsp. durum]|uniref:Uncharacterized protein n=1 Tax=Triticum turgidum subsp. durum TaxID=4567 RepID=A0A9R1AEL1_TRITD|nr:unnamed protein product [Triticum turgidum subsp. durum]